MSVVYNSDNFSKYSSKNPLKILMLKKFYNNLIDILQKEFDAMNLTPKILDMGCGEGFTGKLLIEKFPEINYYGMDLNRHAIAYALTNDSPGTYLIGDIYNIDFPDNEFEITLCLEVLEHLKDPKLALEELLRVTKYITIVSVPNEPYFSLGNLLSLKNIRGLGNPNDHINRWSKEKFIHFLKNGNFDLSNIRLSFPWTIAIITKGMPIA